MLKLRARAPGDVLSNAGQQAHAALLTWLAAVNPELAERLHEPHHDRPFTCSSLWFPGGRAASEVALAQRENRRLSVNPAQTYWLRLTLLNDQLFRTLTRRFLQPSIAVVPGSNDIRSLPTLRLGSVHFDVFELVAMDPSPEVGRSQPITWAGYATYEGLVAQARAFSSSNARTLGLEFRSPTAFSDGQQSWGKRMHLFPEPDRVFDRLARVWNAWAPPDLRLDISALRLYLHNWVAVSSYELETRTLHFDRHAQVGFVGRCTYESMDLSRNAGQRLEEDSAGTLGAGLAPVQVLRLLAAFAFYAGVGQKTTMGMGQARPLPTSTLRTVPSKQAPIPVPHHEVLG
jgi:CRISPR-associated endoribonuclease Cas6